MVMSRAKKIFSSKKKHSRKKLKTKKKQNNNVKALQEKIKKTFKKIDNKEIKPSNAQKVLLKLALETQNLINKDSKKTNILTKAWTDSLDETFKNYSENEKLEWLLSPDFWKKIYEVAPFLKMEKNPERTKKIMKQAVKEFSKVKKRKPFSKKLKEFFGLKKRKPDIIIWTPGKFDTKIDLLLKILEKKKKLRLGKLSELLKQDYELVEEWATILDEKGVIQLKYPLIGDAYVVKRDKKHG